MPTINAWKLQSLYSLNRQDIYNSKATVLFKGLSNTIESVKGRHLKLKTNFDVGILSLKNQPSVTIVPRGIGNFYPNITALVITQCGLTEISRDDFVGLSQLNTVDLRSNEIATIGNDAFANQPNQMISISFSNNPIANVGVGAFSSTNMEQLTQFFFKSTTCFAGREVRRSHELSLQLAADVEENCPPSVDMQREAEISDVKTQLAQFKSDLAEERSLRESQNSNVQVKLGQQEDEINNLKNYTDTKFANSTSQSQLPPIGLLKSTDGFPILYMPYQNQNQTGKNISYNPTPILYQLPKDSALLNQIGYSSSGDAYKLSNLMNFKRPDNSTGSISVTLSES